MTTAHNLFSSRALRFGAALALTATLLPAAASAQQQQTGSLLQPPAEGAATAAKPANAVRTIAVVPLEAPVSLMQNLQTQAERDALKLFADLVHKDIIAALSKVSGFQVVQRQDLSKILAEQELGQSGNVDPATAARIGKLIGADVIATVDLRQFDFMKRETHSAAISRDIVTVSLDAGAYLSLYDSSTGALLASSSGSGKGVDTQQYFANSQRQGGFNRVVVTNVSQEVANALVGATSATLFPARVVAVTGKQVTLSRGAGYFTVGQTIDIMHLGSELKDPDTGASLGREEVLIGKAKVIRVTPQTAAATLTEDNGVSVGALGVATGN